MLMSFAELLGGLGAAAQGFGALKGGSKTKYKGEDVYDAAYRTIEGRHAAAKTMGYHPAYLMGSSVSSPVYSASHSGNKLAGVGKALGDLGDIAAAHGEAPVRKEMQALGLREAEANTKLAETEANIRELELARMQANPAAPGGAVKRQGGRPMAAVDPDDKHRITFEGTPYSTRGGDVRESDLGGFWGEVQNIAHGVLDPAINPLADFGRSVGKKFYQVQKEVERLLRKFDGEKPKSPPKRRADRRSLREKRAAKRRIYPFGQ